MATPPDPAPGSDRRNLRFRAWNLLLLVPMLMLVTPALNFDQPRLWGLPVFYWAQFLFVPVGVICTGIVYAKTKDEDRDGGRHRS